MTRRCYHAAIASAFLSVAALAGCNGGTATPNVLSDADTPTHARAGASAVNIWAAPQPYSSAAPSIVYGLSVGGKSILTTIKTGKQSVPGYHPAALRVDHSQNLWVLNESNTKNFAYPSEAVIQEYSNDGGFTAAYVSGCPSNASPSVCHNFSSEITDIAVNSKYLFAIGLVIFQLSEGPVGYFGYEYWPVGNPSAEPTFIQMTADGGYCQYAPTPLCVPYHGDLDGSGNLWLLAGSVNGFGLLEVTNPTSSTGHGYNVMEPAGTYPSSAGFVYVNGGTMINVGVPPYSSEYAGQIFQYALPLSPGGTPLNVLTPCVYRCFPGDFGFNKTGKELAVGDGSSANGWIDVGVTAKNRWKQVTNPQFVPLGAAVYTPSDK
jgi:hypothetical protein